MNRTIIISNLLLTAFLILPFLGMGQDGETLTFRLTNFKTDEGNAAVDLFRETDDLPKKPFLTLRGVIQEGAATVAIERIPYGEYAAIVYHDRNSNQTLDHKMGFPSEPMGFSNDWKLNIFSGMPTFRKLKFKFDSDHKIIEVMLD